MNLWVRQLRGLCLVGLVLGGVAFCTAVGAVATAGHAAAQSAERNRRRRQPARRSRDDPLLFPAQSGRAPRQLQDRPGAQGALCHRPVPGRPHQPVRRPPDRHRGGKSGHQPGRVRGQLEAQGRAALPTKCNRSRAARCRGRPCRPTCSASSRSTGATAASTSRSSRRSSSCRTTASISCLRSRKARRPASRRSSSSATTPIRDQRLKDVIKTRKRRGFRSSLPADRPTSTIPTASKPTATCSAASISSTAMPTCASFRRCRSTTRTRRASSSPSPSRKARATGSARSTFSRTCRWSTRKRCTAVLRAAPATSTTPRRSKSRSRTSRSKSPGAAIRSPSCGRAATAILANHTINVVFTVEDGPRVYIERINIRGNTRTRDYVIRREFDIGEGDAYNRALIDRAERRLKNLNYFKTVKITNEPGSAPDRIVLNVDVEEISTGEFSVSGGYSTASGWLAEAQRRRAQPARPGPVCQNVACNTANTRAASSCRLPSRISWATARRRHRPLLPSRRWRRITFVQQRNRRHGYARRICAERRALVPGSLQHLLAENHAAVLHTTTVSSRPTPRSIGGTGVSPGDASRSAASPMAAATPTAKSSLAVRKELAAGAVLVSMLGYTRRLQHSRQQQEPDRRPLRRVQAGFRRRRRRRQLHSLDRRRAQLLRDVFRCRRRAAPAGRPYRRLGRQRPAHAGSFPDGAEPGSRLRTVRHRTARLDTRCRSTA